MVIPHLVADFVSLPEDAPVEYPPTGVVGLEEANAVLFMNDYFYFVDPVSSQVTKVELPANLEIFAQSDIGSAAPGACCLRVNPGACISVRVKPFENVTRRGIVKPFAM
jgi:hypothetical protein